MWAATHMMLGGLVYDSVKNERPWLRWALTAVGAGVVGHWLLDSTPVYHNMDWPLAWWQWLIGIYQAGAVALFLWQFDRPNPWRKWLARVLPKRLLIGLVGWLTVDIWWLIHRPWATWLHSLFPNIGRWADPASSALELMVIALFLLMAMDRIGQRRRAHQKGPS